MPVITQKTQFNARRSISATAGLLTQRTESSINTTYTVNSVNDSLAWDLSAVIVGDVVETGDGYKGLVSSIDDANNTVYVQEWKRPAGTPLRRMAVDKPSNGQAAKVLVGDGCVNLIVDALETNTDDVLIGFDSSLADGFPIAALGTKINHRITLNAGKDKYLNMSSVYVKAVSGTQTVAYIAT